MSRRGNCYDNAVTEGFFSLLKTERIKRKIYKTRSEAKAEIFNYIELFYNPSRRHGNNDGVSPIEFEKQYYQKLSSLYDTRGLPLPNSSVQSFSVSIVSILSTLCSSTRLKISESKRLFQDVIRYFARSKMGQIEGGIILKLGSLRSL